MHEVTVTVRDCVLHPRPAAKPHKFLDATIDVASESPYLAEILVKDGDDVVFRAEIPIDALGDLMLAASAMVQRADNAA
jgi:hypothetical protein